MLKRSQSEALAATAAAYRSDIDGLRAVSILAVVWYHAFPPVIPGGFVGVDIFFVISGYLITRIISAELAAESFSLLAFYRRRIRRIFPALIVVMATAFAVGWLVLLPHDFRLLGDNMVGGAGFFANLVQLQGQDYFAPDASSNPLLHLWSLGIEEQFYIFWPLFLILLQGRRFAVLLALAAAAGSFAANCYLVADHQAFAFYSPVTRAWELLAGALLVRSTAGDMAQLRRIPDDVKAAAGTLLIVLAIALLNNTSEYPGWHALMPVIGAILLLDARDSVVNRRLLSHPFMVFVGLVSYPLYLWHWPVLSYLGILRGNDPTVLEKVLAVAVAFILACGTYGFVEKPIRRYRSAVLGLALAMSVTGGIGLWTIWASGFGFRFSPEVSEIASLRAKSNSGFRFPCFVEPVEDFSQRQARCIEAGTGPLMFVWGDSSAAALYPGLRQAQQHHSFRIAQFTTASCPPIIGAQGGSPQCIASNRETFETIAATKPDILLLEAMWSERTDFKGLRDTIAGLKRMGVARIVIVGPVPYWKRTLPFMLVNAYRLQHRLPDRLANDVSGPAADSLMEQFSASEHVGYFSAWKRFCNAAGCLTRIGPSAKDVVASDQAHLTDRGSEFLGEAITDSLLASAKAAGEDAHDSPGSDPAP